MCRGTSGTASRFRQILALSYPYCSRVSLNLIPCKVIRTQKMIFRRYKGPAFAKYCPSFFPDRILGECNKKKTSKTLPISFPIHVGIPYCLTIHNCTVYNPIMIIHLFVTGFDNWSSAFTLSRFIDRLTPMTSHIWREKWPSEICILRNSKFELLKLKMCSILNKKNFSRDN